MIIEYEGEKEMIYQKAQSEIVYFDDQVEFMMGSFEDGCKDIARITTAGNKYYACRQVNASYNLEEYIYVYYCYDVNPYYNPAYGIVCGSVSCNTIST